MASFLQKATITFLVKFKLYRLLAHYCARHLVRHQQLATSPLRTLPLSESTRLLGLSSDMYRHDLAILSENPDCAILSLPPQFQTLLMRQFYSRTYPHVEYHQPKPGSPIDQEQKRYRAFLTKFLTHFYRLTKINCLTSPNVKYREDLDWGAVSNSLGVPFIILHRENFVSAPNIYHSVLKRQTRQGPFQGSHIIVHNDISKRLFLESKIVDSSKLAVLGCLRMDRFVKDVQKYRQESKSKGKLNVLIFGFYLGFDWPEDRDYFSKTYRHLLEFILEHPEIEFVLKPKLKELNAELGRILNIAATDLGVDVYKIANLKILPKADIPPLIFRADVIIAFNTTAILESGIAGKPVIIPFYKEFREVDLLRLGVTLQDEMDGVFDVADDPEHLVRLLKQRLKDPRIDPSTIAKRDFLFEKWLSPLAATATSSYHKKIHDIIAQEYRSLS